MFVFISLIVLLAMLMASSLCISMKVRRLKRRSLNDLLAQLKPVPMRNIALLAEMRTHEYNLASLEQVLRLLGGEQTLDTLVHNANALMDVARYLSIVCPECTPVAIKIRSEAMYLRQLVSFVKVKCLIKTRMGAVQMILSAAATYSEINEDTSKLYVRILQGIDRTLRVEVDAQFAVAVEGDARLVRYN